MLLQSKQFIGYTDFGQFYAVEFILDAGMECHLLKRRDQGVWVRF